MELEAISAFRGPDDERATTMAHVVTGRRARQMLQDTGVVLDEDRETVTTDLDHIDLLLFTRRV